MRKLSRDQALPIVEPHKDRFWRICEESWREWQQLPNIPDYRDRTRANVVNDLMVKIARREFADVHGARFIDVNEKSFSMLLLDDKLLIRFKKFDDRRMPRNYPTQHAQEFNLQMRLPEVPSATRVFCGYRLNPLETEILDVSITCTNGKRPAWYIDLERSEAAVVRLPESGPVNPTDRRPRVRVRRTDVQDDLAL